MWVVANEFEIFVMEVEDALDVWINLHRRQGTWLTRQLELGLLNVVQVEVRVTCGMDEVAWFETCDLSHHLKQQGIRGDVEGYAQKGVGTSLIELQRQAVVGDRELEDGVTGRQRHLVYLGNVPGRDYHTT